MLRIPSLDTISAPEILKILTLSFRAGMAYIVIGPVTSIVDFSMFGQLTNGTFPVMLYVLLKLLVLFSYAPFMQGFVLLGKIYSKKIIYVGAYLSIILTAIMQLSDIYNILFMSTLSVVESTFYIQTILGGSVMIIYGIGLLKLRNTIAYSHKLGVLYIVVGACFLSTYLTVLGLFLLIPTTIVELSLLSKSIKFMKGSVLNRL